LGGSGEIYQVLKKRKKAPATWIHAVRPPLGGGLAGLGVAGAGSRGTFRALLSCESGFEFSFELFWRSEEVMVPVLGEVAENESRA
jgi:hypothetical protein